MQKRSQLWSMYLWIVQKINRRMDLRKIINQKLLFFIRQNMCVQIEKCKVK